MNLHHTLLNKAKEESLGHFYIVEGPSPSELESFIHGFIRDYYQKIEGHKQSLTHLMDHPDVFVLGNLSSTEDPEDKFFSVEESEGLSRFFEFRPVQSKRKFAVITEAHRINTIVANKWLKLLEEPQGECTIFLLNPRRQKLLDTIHSRAIHLRLKTKAPELDPAPWKEFISFTKAASLSQFLEEYSKSDEGIEFYLTHLIFWEALEPEGAEAKEALRDWLKKFQEMDVFHQPTATKWSLFYSFLQTHVIPRFR